MNSASVACGDAQKEEVATPTTGILPRMDFQM